MRTLALGFTTLFVLCCLALGCGGKKTNPGAATPTGSSAMDDPIALLPSAPLVAGNVDAKAFFASASAGAQIAQLVEKLVPIGEEAGFSPSRDVERVVFGVYSMQGADVAAVIVGKLDPQKIRTLAASQAPTKGGGVLVASQYAGRELYTISNVGFTVLSERLALAGSETGIRRTLDRIKDGRVKRDMPEWMIQVLETQGAAVAVAGDFTNQPVAAPGGGMFNLGFVQQMKTARVLANFKDPGVQVAASIGFPDGAQAGQAAEAITKLIGIGNLAGITIRDPKVAVAQNDVQATFAVDDQMLRTLATSLPQWLGMR